MVIIGFCNPLLDITINNVPEIPNLLNKFDLKDNDVILADSKKHELLIEEMIKVAIGKVEYTAGGAGMNSLRCAQLMLEEGSCKIVGSIGDDDFGKILQEKSREAGVQTNFHISCHKPSGRCACIIHGPHRSLVAFLDAANDFRPEHLDEKIEEEIIRSADILYITGFFYGVSCEAVRKILNLKSGATLVFNLSATFVCDLITSQDFDLIFGSINILIGNSDEFLTLYLKHKDLFNFSTEIINYSVEEMARLMSIKFPKLCVMITQGGDPIIIGTNGSVEKIPVPSISSNLIVDTNGAGDAFVGGLLGSLERGLGMTLGIKVGCFLASRVIQQTGIKLPSKYELQEFIDSILLKK